MNTNVHGIPVLADPGITQREISTLIHELVQEWSWEGRHIAAAELIRDGDWIHVCAYEQAFPSSFSRTAIRTKERNDATI